MNTTTSSSFCLDTPEQIAFYAEMVVYRGLKLELKGMRFSRKISCYAQAKNRYGLKGNKQSVFNQLRLILLEKYPFLTI